MELDTALDHARTHQQGVLVTIKGDGRPQLSNIVHAVGDDGRIQISVTETRAKTANMRRDDRVSLYVRGENHWAYLVIDGVAELSPVAAAPDDATVDALVDVYRAVAGEHDDWDAYRSSMVDDGRLVVTITPSHAYGMWS